jgi:predicted transcriptional regulator
MSILFCKNKISILPVKKDIMTLQEKRTTMLSKVKEWQLSGMTSTKFAQKNNIPCSTFSYWVSKSKRLSNNSKSMIEPSDFIRISGDEFLSDITCREIKLQYPNGVSLVMPADTPIKDLKKLINF